MMSVVQMGLPLKEAAQRSFHRGLACGVCREALGTVALALAVGESTAAGHDEVERKDSGTNVPETW